MTQKIYGLVCDNGDGSASIHWFKNKENADTLIDEESSSWDEAYNMNEGRYAEMLVFPEDVNLEKCGFFFQD